jgi:hypothetical protein
MNGERKKTRLIKTAETKEQEKLQFESRSLGTNTKEEDTGYLHGDK